MLELFFASSMWFGFFTGVVFLSLPNAIVQEFWVKPRLRRGIRNDSLLA